jgi:hypothetical protein
MPESQLQLTFQGLDADLSRLDIYDTSISNYGLARTLQIIGHYYVTGDIISHAPKSKLDLWVVPPEPGSFRQKVIAGAVVGIISAPFSEFAGRIIDRWLPSPNDPQQQQIIELLKEQNELIREQRGLPRASPTSTEQTSRNEIDQYLSNHDDHLQILRSITSTSFKNIFRPIGRSAQNVVLTEGPEQRPIGLVDPQLLAQIESDRLDEDTATLTGVVNSFSRSSKTGVMFSEEIGRGFRFQYEHPERLPREDLFSWSQYSGQKIRVTGRFVRFFDEKIKKLLIYHVERDRDVI